MKSPDADIGSLAADATVWNLAASGLSKAVTPVALSILARLLVPEEFGIVAGAAVVLSLAGVLTDAGLSSALVQLDDDGRLDEAASAVHRLQQLSTWGLYLLLFASADPIAVAFGDARVAAVLRVQGLVLPAIALAGVHEARLVRALDYRPLVQVRVAAEATPSLVAIPLAALGAGYWSLTIGALAGVTVRAVLARRLSEWRPDRRIAWPVAKEMANFGLWVAAGGIATWLANSLDQVLIGTVLGPRAIGVYRTTSLIVVTTFLVLLTQASSVFFSAFSRVARDPTRFRRAVAITQRVVAAAAIAVGAGLWAVAPAVEALILGGGGWSGATQVARFVAVAATIEALGHPLRAALRAAGRPRRATKATGLALVAAAPAYAIGSQHGIYGLLLARVALATVGLVAMVLAAREPVGTSLLDLGRAALRPAVAAAAMLGAVGVIANWLPLTWLSFVVQIVSGATVYVCVLGLLDRTMARDLTSRARALVR